MAPQSNSPSTSGEPPTVPEYRCPRCGSTRAIGRLGTTERVSGSGPSGTYEAVTRAFMTCEDCTLIEDLLDDRAGHDAYVVAIKRWRNPEFDEVKPYYSAVDFHSDTREGMLWEDKRDRNYTWPEDPWREVAEYEAAHAVNEQEAREKAREQGEELPENDALFAQVIANPKDSAPRWAYANWLGELPPSVEKGIDGNWYVSSTEPQGTAWEVIAQLRTWEAWRADPKADVAQCMYKADESYQSNISELRGGKVGRHHFLCVNFVEFFYVRGFVEYIDIKASAFLRFAPFLYSLAPVRHLGLTYTRSVMAELVASPHLARICTVRLPNRIRTNEYTRLNDLVDEDIAVLASSPQLANLELLDLEDNEQLTIRAFDHLALSPHLRSLSHVAFEVYHYDRAFGRFGPHQKTFLERRNERWRDELEARHGYLPWLHPDEHYGVPHPRLEQVNAHPVGVATFRPDIAARRRAHLPVYILDAIRACVIVDGRIELRERSLTVPLRGSEGEPIGHFVAAIHDAQPDAAIPDLRALVTLTISRLEMPSPHAVSAYDHATAANVLLTENQTITLGIPVRAYALQPSQRDIPQAQ